MTKQRPKPSGVLIKKTIAVDPEQYRLMKAQAAVRGIDMTTVFQQALEWWLEKESIKAALNGKR